VVAARRSLEARAGVRSLRRALAAWRAHAERRRRGLTQTIAARVGAVRAEQRHCFEMW